MKTIDLSDLKAGDKAWSCVFGTVIIHGINNETNYPIEVNACTFDVNGFQKYIHTHPTLFHSEQEFREYWGLQRDIDAPLTKREQFAMALMQPMMANPSWEDYELEEMIKAALIATDALLTKLNEKNLSE
jgi:hypothetical protein